MPGVGGRWKDFTDNVNLLAGNLTTLVRNIAEVPALSPAQASARS